MPSDSVEITKPVAIQNDAKARVAFDLMQRIASEENANADLTKTRAYWLTLYRQCYKAADGELLQYVLEAK